MHFFNKYFAKALQQNIFFNNFLFMHFFSKIPQSLFKKIINDVNNNVCSSINFENKFFSPFLTEASEKYRHTISPRAKKCINPCNSLTRKKEEDAKTQSNKNFIRIKILLKMSCLVRLRFLKKN